MKFRLFSILFLLLILAGTVIWWILVPSEKVSGDVNQIAGSIPEKINFNFHVKPILSDKCFTCHGPDANQRKAGLRFDLAEPALAVLPENPGKYAIVPGDINKSMLIERIFNEDPSMTMPPPESNLQLSEFEKNILYKWIEQGAQYNKHWAFLIPEKPELPPVNQKGWVQNEIDAFILSKLEEKGLAPSKPAKKEQLYRRLSLDLAGLPPNLKDVEAFIEDESDNAYAQVVSKILSSSSYGERMTQEWLDLSRYADSHGYQDDSYRTMWPWRDWLIHAFNKNMPYDQFLTMQLAGDLQPNANKEQLLATGFNRNHPITQEGGVIDEEYRSAYVSDRTNTFGKGILGVTLECAKCHDHKYDPISQKDYFSVYSFFNNVNEKGLQMDAVQAASKNYFADAPFISITDDDLGDILSFVNKPVGEEVKVMVMNDSMVRNTYVLARGSYDAPTTQVFPATPSTILAYPDTLPGNRYGLAQWICSDQNPLTARVYVNRLWAMLFGQGLVKTVENFGNQGSLPSHPELLDWLAITFMENDWDIKFILEKMVSSATYRQDSKIAPEMLQIDPENVLLARGPRFRMSAEMIRDYVLKTSGILNSEIGGPSVKPYQPAGLWEETNAGSGRGILTTYQADKGDKLYRRSLYTLWKRTLPPPAMALFDAPNRDICEVRRQKTNTPLQALALQNDVQILEATRVLAQNTEKKQIELKETLTYLFQQILIRKPQDYEMSLLEDYYQKMIDRFSNEEENAEELLKVGKYPQQSGNVVKTASLMMVAQVLYNLDETVTKE